MSDARFEQRYGGADRAISRERHVSRLLVGDTAIVMAAPLAAAAVAMALSPAGLPGALLPRPAAAIVALATGCFAATRVRATPTHFEVRYRTLGPSIPVAALTPCEVAEPDSLERLAFGVSGLQRGWDRGVRGVGGSAGDVGASRRRFGLWRTRGAGHGIGARAAATNHRLLDLCAPGDASSPSTAPAGTPTASPAARPSPLAEVAAPTAAQPPR